MAENHEGRISALEADSRTSQRQWDDIKGFMIRQSSALSDIKSTLAVIADKQDSMQEYQVECTKERVSQDKRITAVEGFQVRQLKLVGMLSVGLSSVIGYISKQIS